ncbi:MAG: pilus assembly protein N-terminal domain-containing protein [Bacteroidales bacterium]|nr:pilus assembly protein N-terminal domain-containing protein [Bacteroidales bacterium]
MKRILKLVVIGSAALALLSCQRQLRKSPDIRMEQHVVAYVGDTTLVRVSTPSDGKKKVSVADTTIAKATLLPEIPGPIFVLGVKEGTTTLKFEVGLTKAFNWGEATCTVEVRPARAN